MRVLLVAWLLTGVATPLILGEGTKSLERKMAEGPLVSLPAGWQHLSLQVRDSGRGAYLDEVTGALVHYGIGPFDPHPRDAGAARSTGELGGSRYELVRIRDARSRAITRWRREIGPEFPRRGTLDDILVPPDGATEIALTVGEQKRAVNFEAYVCGKEEESRVERLLLGQSSVRLSAGRRDERDPAARLLDELALGTAIGRVIERWGAPVFIWRPACDRLAVVYDAAVKGQQASVRLTFDAGRRLVEKTPTMSQ
jgi:hypothetical protein